ncbi:ApeA N-terminal domain 1-containing protein [Pedobacter sp.]
MRESKQFKGIWYLPDSPEIEVAGTLNYIPGKSIKLELIGDLQGRGSVVDFLESRHFEVIHGITNKGIEISLFDCLPSCDIVSERVPMTFYNAVYMIEGKHMDRFDQPSFDRMEVGFVRLAEWIGEEVMRVNMEKVGTSGYNTSVCYGPDKQFHASYGVEEDFVLEIDMLAVGNFQFGSVQIQNEATAAIECPRMLSAWDLHKEMNVFQSFLSFGLLEHAAYSFTRLRDKDSGLMVEYYWTDFREVQVSAKKQRKLFRFADVKENLLILLKAWYGTTKEVFPIRRHLMEAVFISDSFSSNNFVTVAFALEGFYHRFVKTQRSSKGNLKSAISSVQKRFRDLSFMNRIKVDTEQVNDSRNYYAHLYHREPHHQILVGERLFRMNEKLKVFLVLCMLEQMGIDHPHMEKMVSKSRLLENC